MTGADLMREWFLGDEAAVDFALAWWDACQEWDDLEDEGRAAQGHAFVAWLAFGKERDPFFAAHAGQLRPVLESVYLQWTAANVLERSPVPDDQAKAWVLRAGFYGLLHMIANVVGGHDHAVSVGPAIWRSYGESLHDFRREMNACLE